MALQQIGIKLLRNGDADHRYTNVSSGLNELIMLPC